VGKIQERQDCQEDVNAKKGEQPPVERLVSQDNPASRKAFEVQYCNLFAKYPFDDEDKKMLWDMWSEGVVWGQDNPYSD